METPGVMDPQTEIPPLPCGHGLPPLPSRGFKARCTVCGSFWDMDALRAGFKYDKTYPAIRGHYSSSIGQNKKRTLALWLKRTGIETRGKNVCEVGFGGGACLKHLSGVSSNVYGIEMIPANISHAIELGIKAGNLFLFDDLPDKLPLMVDLWLFQDSFEHIDGTAEFVSWIKDNSSPNAEILIVAPQSGSLSERFMGKFWPHKLNEHKFHWSRQGLVAFYKKADFLLTQSFSPEKYVSVSSIIRHILTKASVSLENAVITDILSKLRLTLCFNIGEMGLVFKRTDDSGP